VPGALWEVLSDMAGLRFVGCGHTTFLYAVARLGTMVGGKKKKTRDCDGAHRTAGADCSTAGCGRRFAGGGVEVGRPPGPRCDRIVDAVVDGGADMPTLAYAASVGRCARPTVRVTSAGKVGRCGWRPGQRCPAALDGGDYERTSARFARDLCGRPM